MKFILAGKHYAAIEAAKIFKSLGIDIAVCPSAGEEKIKELLSLREYAINNGIEILDNLDEIRAKKVFLLSVEFDKIVQRNNFAKGSRFYNIHFSLLPKYRGTMTSFWPILLREKYSGITLHEIDDSIDTGNIIKQLTFEIMEDYTCRDLYFQYHFFTSELLKESLPNLIEGNFNSVKQPNDEATTFPRFLYKYIPKSFRSNQLKLMEYDDVYNMLRSLIFEEYQLPIVDDKKIIKISKRPFEGFNLLLSTNSKELFTKYIQ